MSSPSPTPPPQLQHWQASYTRSSHIPVPSAFARPTRREKGKGKASDPPSNGGRGQPYPPHNNHHHRSTSAYPTTLTPSPLHSPTLSPLDFSSDDFASHLSPHTHSFSSSSRFLSPSSSGTTGDGSTSSTPQFAHSIPAPPSHSFSSLFVGGGGATGGIGGLTSSSGESSEAGTPLSAETGVGLGGRRGSKGVLGAGGVGGWSGVEFAHAVGVGLGNLDAVGYQEEDMGAGRFWEVSMGGYMNGRVGGAPVGMRYGEGLGGETEERRGRTERVGDTLGGSQAGRRPSGRSSIVGPEDSLRRPMFALPIEDLIGGFEADDSPSALQDSSALSSRWGDDIDMDGGISRAISERTGRTRSLGELSASSVATFQDTGSGRMWRRDGLGLPVLVDEEEVVLRRSSGSMNLSPGYYAHPNLNGSSFIAPPLPEFSRLAESEERRGSLVRHGMGGLPDAIDPNVFASPAESSAARMPSPELNEDSETDAGPVPPSPTRRRSATVVNFADLPPLKKTGIPGPAFPRRMGQKRPNLPPPPPPSGVGPSAFPTLVASLDGVTETADGMKVLARGFSKGNENSVPGAMYVCENCGETHTPLWRRSEKNELLCNACGLYVRTHHQHRPIDQAMAAREKRMKDPGSRKRKIKAICNSCKDVPEIARDPSCSACAKILQAKEDNAARRKARMLKQAQATEVLAAEAGLDLSLSPREFGSPSSFESSFLSTSPGFAGLAIQTPVKSVAQTLSLPSVGGRRGKQPPGAGIQPPRGGSGSSSVSVSSSSAIPPAVSTPPMEDIKPKLVPKIRIKRKIEHPASDPLQSPPGKGKNFESLLAAAGLDPSSFLIQHTKQPIKLLSKSASSPALTLVSSSPHPSSSDMEPLSSPVKKRRMVAAEPAEGRMKGGKGWAWVPVGPEEFGGKQDEEAREGAEMVVQSTGRGSGRAARHKKRTSVSFVTPVTPVTMAVGVVPT